MLRIVFKEKRTTLKKLIKMSAPNIILKHVVENDYDLNDEINVNDFFKNYKEICGSGWLLENLFQDKNELLAHDFVKNGRRYNLNDFIVFKRNDLRFFHVCLSDFEGVYLYPLFVSNSAYTVSFEKFENFVFSSENMGEIYIFNSFDDFIDWYRDNKDEEIC